MLSDGCEMSAFTRMHMAYVCAFLVSMQRRNDKCAIMVQFGSNVCRTLRHTHTIAKNAVIASIQFTNNFAHYECANEQRSEIIRMNGEHELSMRTNTCSTNITHTQTPSDQPSDNTLRLSVSSKSV